MRNLILSLVFAFSVFGAFTGNLTVIAQHEKIQFEDVPPGFSLNKTPVTVSIKNYEDVPPG